MKNILLLCWFLGYGLFLQGQTMEWNSANGFSGWNKTKNAELTLNDDIFKLKITSKAPRLYHPYMKIDTTKCNILKIRCRLSGISSPASGNIFFQGKNQKSFSAECRAGFRLPSANGVWHDLKIPLGKAWKECHEVVALRIDFADQVESGIIEIQSIELQKDPERLEAKHTPWPDVKSNLPNHQKKDKLPREYWSGKMVSARGDTGEISRNFALRRSFEVNQDLTYAQMQITADDRMSVYFNGKLVLDRMKNHYWAEPVFLDITPYLIPGQKNLLAIEYRNIAGPGGVLFEIDMFDKDRNKTKVVSDDRIVCTLLPTNSNWIKSEFTDDSWQKVNTHPAPPVSPWQRILNYYPAEYPLESKLIDSYFPSIGIAGKMLPVKLTFDHDSLSAFQANVKLVTLPNRIQVAELRIPAVLHKNTALLDIPLPRWFSACDMELEIILPGHLKLTRKITYQPQKDTVANSVLEVKKNGDNVFLSVDGKPTFMLCGNVHMEESMVPSRLNEVPVNFRTCHIKQNNANRTWIRSLNGDYDFTVFDRIVERKLAIDENVKLIFNLDLELPVQFRKELKEQLTKTHIGTMPSNSALCASFASQKVRKITRDAIIALIRHCEKAPYASKVGGYLLNSGVSQEWQYWTSERAMRDKALPDYIKIFKDLFEKENGMPFPSADFYMKKRPEIFLDPIADASVLKANQFFSKLISDTIIDYCSAAKNAMTVKKLIGVYFGYHLEYSNCDWRRQLAGHNDLQRVLDAGVVDFMLSPPSYTYRNLGDSGADMKAFTSLATHGVLSIIDDDTRTDIVPYNGYYQTITPAQTISVIRRNLGMYLCRGQNLWLLPLTTGREFDANQTLADLRKFKLASEYQTRHPTQHRPETVFVLHEKSYNYMGLDSMNYSAGQLPFYDPHTGEAKIRQNYVNRLTAELLGGQVTRLSQAGIPFDCILSGDIKNHIGKYKFWIFADFFTYDDELLKAVKKLQEQDTVLFWFYAPGLFKNGKKSLDYMQDLTGFHFAKMSGAGSPEIEIFRDHAASILTGIYEELSPRFQIDDSQAVPLGKYHDDDAIAFACKTTGKAKSFFFGGNNMSAGAWNYFAKKIGIHVYSDTLDPVYANDRFLTLHARTPGKKVIRFTKKSDVSDLFTGKLLAENVKEYVFDAKLHETKVFFLGKAGELKN